jgi:hypothetical protein
LVIIQPLKVLEGKNVLSTKIIDGTTVLAESEIILPDMQDPQKLGSAITYYRRYSLQSLLLLEAEDNDGNDLIPAKVSAGYKESFNKREEVVDDFPIPQDIF